MVLAGMGRTHQTLPSRARPRVLVGGLRKYCMAQEVSKVIEQASSPMEAWRLLELHFDMQTAIIDYLMSQS